MFEGISHHLLVYLCEIYITLITRRSSITTPSLVVTSQIYAPTNSYQLQCSGKITLTTSSFKIAQFLLVKETVRITVVNPLTEFLADTCLID